MASPQHDALTSLGAAWLRRQGFPVVATELAAAGSRERADVVGFRATCSAMIEVKVSRTDFLADAGKPERAAGGLGLYRFYLCPPEVIGESDLPPGWGLLHAEGRKVVEVVRPMGNLWPGAERPTDGWAGFQHEPDVDAERAVLFSIARRLTAGSSTRWPELAEFVPTHRHYKGGVYQLLDVGRHSETLDEMAIYRNAAGEIWVRPLSMWNEIVTLPDGGAGYRFQSLLETT